MTLQMNDYLKPALASNLKASDSVHFSSGTFLRVYPATVPYPTNPIDTTTSMPAGYILSYTGLTYSLSGSTIYISLGTTSANSSAAGTIGWWALLATSTTNGAIISDSIGLSGSGSVLTVNTMTPTNGQSVSIALNLTLS